LSSATRAAVASASLLAAPAPAGSAAAAPASALIKLPSGITLHYAVQGPPGGTPVVLLHGIGDSWRSYELVLPHLPERYRVVAVTFRGHGWSDRPDSGYRREDYAADVSQLLGALDLRNVTLVGHSLGSFVAQEVAAAGGGRVDRLVLVGSAAGGVREEGIRTEARKAFEQVQDPMDAVFARDFQASTAHRPLPAVFFETMAAEIRRVPARVWKEAAGSITSGAPYEKVRAIQARTLLIWGDRDALMSRADQDDLVARIPGAKLLVYRDTGHAPHWEQPERFARDLAAFVDGTAVD
jgi:pimeloyl-ACP methyl ester carboxylesterase